MINDRLGNWNIYRELGRGGMGRVYLAKEELTGMVAAIKVLAAELAQDVGFLQRFQIEIQSLRQLDHPNIIKFYESGYENGFYFYAMEYIDGQSLEAILLERSRIEWPEVLAIALQVCKALKHAHDHGIIHRDIKPGNLILDGNGIIKLGDFGIAKVFASGHLTATGGVVGTAEFLSPEQASGKQATKRSDLYSLGVVLYTLITGRPPFEGKTHLDLLHKHRYAQFDHPIKYVPEIPLELDDIICQLLEKDPAKRPADALVLSRLLEKVQLKMEKKSQYTEVSRGKDPTIAENALMIALDNQEGPATLMSRLMREELEKEKRGNRFSQFLNHPLVLVVLLAVCLGILIWTFWPVSADSLFERGKNLMASEDLSDKQKAWEEYLEPLQKNYPDNPYQEEVASLKKELDQARMEKDLNFPSESERLAYQAQQLLDTGNIQAATLRFQAILNVFSEIESQKVGVEMAKKGLQAIKSLQKADGRWEAVNNALKEAVKLNAAKKTGQALKILDGLQTLYANDPSAQAILQRVENLRKEMTITMKKNGP